MEPTPETERPCRTVQKWDAQAAAQRELLHDPLRFAEAMWEGVFGSAVMELNWTVSENQSRENLDAYTQLIRRAIDTPGADPKDLLGWQGDLINNHASEQEDIGRRQGVILEHLRHTLIAYFAACASDVRNSDHWDSERVRETRQHLDDLEQEGGEAA